MAIAEECQNLTQLVLAVSNLSEAVFYHLTVTNNYDKARQASLALEHVTLKLKSLVGA